MKKFARILWFALLAIVVILIAALLLVQTPMVQTKLVQQIEEKVFANLDADVSFSKIHFRPFSTVVIRDLAIVDRNPAIPSEAAMEHFRDEHGDDYVYEPYDTLLRAGYIIAKLDLSNMLPRIVGKEPKKGGIVIDRALVRDGRFHLVVEENRLTNLQRMFGMNPSTGERKPETDKDVFSLKKAELRNMEYSMCIIKEKHPHHKGGINWCDLHVTDLNATASDVAMSKGIMSGTLDKASFKEKSGLQIDNITANTAVGRGKAIIENIHIQDPYSDLKAKYFSMSFDAPKDFRDFKQKIRLDGKLEPSHADTRTLAAFVPSLAKMGMTLDASGEIHGTVDSFNLEHLRMSADGGALVACADGKVSGITADKPLALDIKLHDTKTSTHGMEQFLSGITGKNVSFGDKVPNLTGVVNAHVKGPLDNLCIKSDIATNAGSLWTDIDIKNLTEKSKLMNIDGVIKTTNLDVSKVIASDLVKECSLESRLHAVMRGKDGPTLKIDTLKINRLNIKGYDYSKILATGDLNKQKFNGRVISQDPNFNFLFQGIFTFSPKTQNALYQFYANVGHADLHALNLDSRENSTMSFVTNANFNKTGSGMMIGNINIHDLRLTSEDETYKFGEIYVGSRSDNNEYRVNLNSGIAKGAFVGSGTVGDFAKDIIGITARRELPSLFTDGEEFQFSGNRYKLDFNCIDTKGITAFFKPGLYIDNNTSLALTVSKEGKAKATLKSHRLAMKDKYIKDMELKLDNMNDKLSGELTAADINVSALQFINNTLQLLADDDTIGVGLICDGEEGNSPKGEIFARGSLSRQPLPADGSNGARSSAVASSAGSSRAAAQAATALALHADVLPSAFSLGTGDWSIMPATIDFFNGDIDINELTAYSGEQSLMIDGGLSSAHADTLSVDIENLSLELASVFLGDKYEIKGDATGVAKVISYAEAKNKGILVDLISEGTTFAGTDLGDVEIDSAWDEELNRFNLHGGNGETFELAGTFTPSSRDAEIDAKLKNFQIGVINPLLGNLFTELDGPISADVSLSGPINNLEIKSSNGYINDTKLILDYTHVPYIVKGPFHVDESGIYFDNVALRDFGRGTGSVNGVISYDHFKDLGVNLKILANNCKLIQIPESDEDGFYGNLVGSGSVYVHGPLSVINVEIDAQTTDGGDFHVPMSSKGSDAATELLTFKEPYVEVVVDPYEEMMNSLNEKKKSGTDLIVKVKARATQAVQAFLDIDKNGSTGLSGHGAGNFDVEVRPSRGVFNLKGDYALNDGTFVFNAMNIAKREFAIKEGSNVKFNGAIMDTDLDVEAIYKTKTSLARLISDTTSVNTRRLVECGISISEKLSNPSLGFSINVPDLEPSVKAQVENALSTEDKVQKQFIALLLTNNFLPDEQSGVTSESPNLIYSSVTSVFTNQLNNILSKLDIPLDVDMRYQQNQRGNDIFDVAVSTQLFNNRVVVNGNIGNRQYNTGNSNSDVVGDMDIEIKLDKPGAIRLNLFTHSADQYTNYLDNSQRSGLGLTFQQEFNRFVEMIRYVFASRARKEEINAAAAAAAAAEPQTVLVVGD